MTKDINITEIADLLYMTMLLKEDEDGNYISGVCEGKDIHMDALPTTENFDVDRMVVIDMESSLSNNGAFGYGTIRVWLYSKDSDMGAILSDMESKFSDAIKGYKKSKDSAYIELNPRYTYRGHFPQRKLRFYVKELNVKIKK